jgi:hypothetical protein
MARSMERLQSMYRSVIWNAQVDDLAATVFEQTRWAAVVTAAKVYESVKSEMQERCFLPLAGDKTTVVSTVVGAAEEVAQLIGPCAEVGSWCKKFGRFWRLKSSEAGPEGLPAAPGRQVVAVRAEAKWNQVGR